MPNHLTGQWASEHYMGDEYCIGGNTSLAFSELDKAAASEGQWLPHAAQLLEWLHRTGFVVSITMDTDRHFIAQATDTLNSTEYQGGGYTLADALAKMIINICKSHLREYMPTPTLKLVIEHISDHPNN